MSLVTLARIEKLLAELCSRTDREIPNPSSTISI